MTHDEKINYMKLACGLCRFAISTSDMDLLVSMYDGIVEKQGHFTLADAARIETQVKEREILRQAEQMETQQTEA